MISQWKQLQCLMVCMRIEWYHMIVNGEELVGTQYSGKPSIPGPTIIMTEGDDANVTLT